MEKLFTYSWEIMKISSELPSSDLFVRMLYKKDSAVALLC